MPDDDKIFAPEVLNCSEEELEIKLHLCPLKDAYREAGLSEEEMATMLSIELKAEKLFFVTAADGVTGERYSLPDNPSIAEDGHLARMTLSEAAVFLLLNGGHSMHR